MTMTRRTSLPSALRTNFWLAWGWVLSAPPLTPSPPHSFLTLQDIVILHPDTAHTGGPNTSCSIRSMVYFRLRHRQLREHDALYREDMWVDLPGAFEWRN
jgi:hypothetical protein